MEKSYKMALNSHLLSCYNDSNQCCDLWIQLKGLNKPQDPVIQKLTSTKKSDTFLQRLFHINAQQGFTIINYPQQTRSIYRHNRQLLLSSSCMLVLNSPPRKDGKLSGLLRERRSPKYLILDQAGDLNRDLLIGRQRSYHCANPSPLKHSHSLTLKAFKMAKNVYTQC